MSASSVRKPTLAERESLVADTRAKKTGFTPRPVERLATRRKPHSMLNVECNHLLRNGMEDSTHGIPPLSYRMWLEAGKHQPPGPEKPDPTYNSNVWRNFRKTYGFHANTEGQKMNEMIAAMYPLNVPPPSKVGDYSYSKFLTDTPLIRDPKLRRRAIKQSAHDVAEFKQLRLKSESRAPPLDEKGNIVPPVGWKEYGHYFAPPEQLSDEPQTPEGPTRIDMFGRNVPKNDHVPFFWKLTYKVNHPEYRKVMDEVQQQRANQTPVQNNPSLSTTKVH